MNHTINYRLPIKFFYSLASSQGAESKEFGVEVHGLKLHGIKVNYVVKRNRRVVLRTRQLNEAIKKYNGIYQP